MRKIILQEYKWGFLRTYTYDVPQTWNEMNAQQFQAVTALFQGRSAEEDFFLRFFGFSRTLLQRLNSYHLYKLGEMVGFLSQLNHSIDRFLIPDLPGPGAWEFSQKLLSPGERLTGMSFQQFISADTFFSFYVCTGQERFLDRFVACLYLLPNETFVILNKKEKLLNVEARAAYLEGMEHDLKYAIFMNWMFIKNWLGELFRYMFPKGQIGKKEEKPKPTDWLSLFDNFVGDHIPDMISYQKMPCMDAFRIINRKIKDHQKK